MRHSLVVGGYLNCQIQEYCGYGQTVFTCQPCRMTGVVNFSSEKNYISSGAEKCSPRYIQTMEQTSDGTDKA